MEFKTVKEELSYSINEVKKIKDKMEFNHSDGSKSTFYLKDKNDYSFHLYKIEETPIKQKETLSEMFYDLRFGKYYIKRNLHTVTSSVDNFDRFMGRDEEIIDLIEVEANKGMYTLLLREIGYMGRERVAMMGRALKRLIENYNTLEILYKAGLPIIGEVVELSYNNPSTKPHEIVGWTKGELKIYKEIVRELQGSANMDGNYKEKAYKEVSNAKAQLSRLRVNFERGEDKGEEIKSLRHYYDKFNSLIEYNKELEEYYGVTIYDTRSLRLGAFISAHYITLYGRNESYSFRNNGFTGLFSMSKYMNLDVKRLIEYVYECEVSQGLSKSATIQYLFDYLKMHADLRTPKYVKYPRFLRTYHDVVARNLSFVKDKIQSEKYELAMNNPEYKEWDGWTKEKYVVVVPFTSSLLVNEGSQQSHCVGGYVSRVSNHRSLIIFLRTRKNPDESLLTVEINPNTYAIVQARGKHNRSATPEENSALRSFARKFNLNFQGVKRTVENNTEEAV